MDQSVPSGSGRRDDRGRPVHAEVRTGPSYRRYLPCPVKSEDFRRLSKQGLTSRLSEANKQYSTLLIKSITISNVNQAFLSVDGDISYILDMRKWKNVNQQIQSGGDFKHVEAKQIESNAPNTRPPAGIINENTLSSPDLSPEQMKDVFGSRQRTVDGLIRLTQPK